jgi:hypothetical protein
MSDEKLELHVVPDRTSIYSGPLDEDFLESLREEKKLPTLPDLLKKLKEDLEAAGIKEWETTIETYLEVSSGTILPGGKAGIKTTIKLSGKASP